jgi:putative membrane protein
MTDKADTAAPPDTRTTTLAFERTRLAYERTMMAWIRTGTALITFGFSVYKFFQFELKTVEAEPLFIGPRGFGLVLIAIGLMTLVIGSFEYSRDLKGLRAQYVGMPRSASVMVALVVGLLGFIALVAVLLRL